MTHSAKEKDARHMAKTAAGIVSSLKSLVDDHVATGGRSRRLELEALEGRLEGVLQRLRHVDRSDTFDTADSILETKAALAAAKRVLDDRQQDAPTTSNAAVIASVRRELYGRGRETTERRP